jgi:hypothetical protein
MVSFSLNYSSPKLDKSYPINLLNKGVVQEKEVPLLSSKDVSLFASNVFSIASKILVNQGVKGVIPSTISELGFVPIAFFESCINTNTDEDALKYRFLDFPVMLSRIYLLKSLARFPELAPVAIILNGYATYKVFERTLPALKRCWEQLKQSDGKNYSLIAKSLLVHGFNASCSTYTTLSLFSQYQQWLFKKIELKSLFEKSNNEGLLEKGKSHYEKLKIKNLSQGLSFSCESREKEVSQLLAVVRETLSNGGSLSLMPDTNSGTYYVKDLLGNIIALFKPSNEGNGERENRQKNLRRNEGSFSPAKKQALAFSLDFGGKSCLPLGVVTEITSDIFVDLQAERKGIKPRQQSKLGYLQEWVGGTTPLVQYHPDLKKPDARKAAYKIENNPMLDKVPLAEFQKIALLDTLLINQDRHPGNILIKDGKDGIPHMIPIDMDMILPSSFEKVRLGLFEHKKANQPFTADNLKYIQMMDPNEMARKVKSAGFSDIQARNVRIQALMVKTFAAEGLSLHEMNRFALTSGRLKELVDRAKRREESSKVEGSFWKYLKKGVERESYIAKAKKNRRITFGTTYIAGNAYRDSLSKLVSENQQFFARLWDLDGRVVTENLLKNRCAPFENIFSTFKDCVPYWNKIAVLLKWLEEKPIPGKEEWYIIADDDMPVTNMNFNPYEAIDLIRRGKDSSIVIVRDVADWRGHKDLSVNTGLLIVRKDANSKKFIEKVWKKRNESSRIGKSDCPTLGTCIGQDVLHEQEAFARVIEENRSCLDKTVSIIAPRDFYKGKEIALNTFNRHGSFSVNGGICFNYDDSDRAYPKGAFRKGDAMGQTAGVPVRGNDCASFSFGDQPLREKKLKNMLSNVIFLDQDL